MFFSRQARAKCWVGSEIREKLAVAICHVIERDFHSIASLTVFELVACVQGAIRTVEFKTGPVRFDPPYVMAAINDTVVFNFAVAPNPAQTIETAANASFPCVNQGTVPGKPSFKSMAISTATTYPVEVRTFLLFFLVSLAAHFIIDQVTTAAGFDATPGAANNVVFFKGNTADCTSQNLYGAIIVGTPLVNCASATDGNACADLVRDFIFSCFFLTPRMRVSL